MANLNEQFDVLSNTLRLLPEEIIRLNYFIKEIDEPEEGISNVEAACANVFNQIYGLMCALKDTGACASIYEHDAISTVLCIRHVLQHQSGRIKNSLRDAWSKSIVGRPALIKYGVSDPGVPDQPFYISVSWFQDGIRKSNNSKRLASINAYWKLDLIKQQVEMSGLNWNATYICAMALITEAIRTMVFKYGHLLSAAGYDSNVYLEHFKEVRPVDTGDYGVIA
ncbi:hypothetical protein [Limnobacter sp.]